MPVTGLYIGAGFGANWLQETDLRQSGSITAEVAAAVEQAEDDHGGVGDLEGHRHPAAVAKGAQAPADGVATGAALRKVGKTEAVPLQHLDIGERARRRRGIGDAVVEVAQVGEGLRGEDDLTRHAGRPSGGRRDVPVAPYRPGRR
jgi:hypothetical protein